MFNSSCTNSVLKEPDALHVSIHTGKHDLFHGRSVLPRITQLTDTVLPLANHAVPRNRAVSRRSATVDYTGTVQR